MKCISSLSTAEGKETATASVLKDAADRLGGTTADLTLLFASSHHADALRGLARALRDRGLSRHVLGCSGESIVGEGREVEAAPALSLWAIELAGARLTPRRIAVDGDVLSGWHEPSREAASQAGNSTLIMLGDPFSFPTDAFLKLVNESTPGIRVVGGMASASQVEGGNRLVLDDTVFDSGAVAVEIKGPVTVRSVVSQGCRPIGRTMIVTKSDRNLICELGRRPAVEVLRDIFESLDEADQERVQQGLHIGRVINEYQESFHRGDFLVRNVLGVDNAGGIAINDVIRVGQTVQFHVRDADSADEDLRTLLGSEIRARSSKKFAGALLFTCNGRGTRMFAEPNHDVGVVREILGPVPVAGFFAMGELGPVGGQNFIHGFTASVVVFGEGDVPAG
jgi:small ligand-binding sensory domain FIST